MTQLEDRRPHVFMELQIGAGIYPSSEGHAAGLLLQDLLETYPDIDLPTIRVWRHSADGVPTMRVDARRGELAAAECPQCHQVAGRPHTDYCTLSPGAVWDDQSLGVDCPSCYRLRKVTPDSHCSKPELHTEPQGPPMHAWTDDNGTPRAHPVSTCSPTLCGLEPW